MYNENRPSPASNHFGPRDEAAERARRTSISGILQRPDSEPQQPAYAPPTVQNGNPFGRPASTNGDLFTSNRPMAPSDRSALSGSYDTRPPPFSNLGRPVATAPTSTPKENPKAQDRRDAQSLSPDFRRVQPSQEPRSLANILNITSDTLGSQNMKRQESAQSQTSAFGERYRARAFSPFAGSVASQTMSVTSMPVEEQARKGSDELSQHRTLLGLAAESKRGRYSPVPQAVQGAQAQTPVPDPGIKNEHGRVFSGLGGGLGNGTRPGLAASPFKANEGAARLSEENLMKISRSSSGIAKRSRKYDDEIRAESDAGITKKPGRGNKRSKYAHSYRVDLDDNTRRATPLSEINPMRGALTPTSGTLHPHHLERQTSAADQLPLFKPKKTIHVSSVISSAKRLPRRHIGSFRYDPTIDQADASRPGHDKFDISIRPNLLPAFTEAEKVNCTYTVRVPNLWLQERERRLICKESYLWGSGIYSDDSDVIAAAMHSGFIKAVAPETVDQVLLGRVVNEQNTKIEGLVNVPDKPVEPVQGHDALITLVVLPTLDRYTGSSRFGVCSRSWPEPGTKTQHDGVSYAVLKVEFVSGGVESRRMGRTGVSKRARIKAELEARSRGEKLRKEMIEKIKAKRMEMNKDCKTPASKALKSTIPEVVKPQVQTQVPQAKKSVVEEAKKDAPMLDVGQAPGEWLRQLEVSAVE